MGELGSGGIGLRPWRRRRRRYRGRLLKKVAGLEQPGETVARGGVGVGAGFDEFYGVIVVEVVVFDVGKLVVQVVELGIVAVAGIDIDVVDAIFILHAIRS